MPDVSAATEPGPAAVRVLGGRGTPRALVIVLHGGRTKDRTPTRPWQLPYVRMRLFAYSLRWRLRRDRVAVWLVRNRVRGWNGATADPVRDALSVLARTQAEHPEVPVVVVGHSMGGRAALQVAGSPVVVGVCALAPWIEPGDPVEQLAGRAVVIAHGSRDRVTDPARSFVYARRAQTVTDRVAAFEISGSGHTMLRRARDWSGLAARFVLGATSIEPWHPALAEALANPVPFEQRVPLPNGVR